LATLAIPYASRVRYEKGALDKWNLGLNIPHPHPDPPPEGEGNCYGPLPEGEVNSNFPPPSRGRSGGRWEI